MILKELSPLFSYLSKHKKGIAVGCVWLILTNCFVLSLPWVLKYAIDGLKGGINSRALSFYASLILAVSLVAGVFRFLMRRGLIGISRKIEYDLRNDFFRHLQRLSPSYFNRTPTGDLMSRATNDLDAVRMLLGPGLLNLFNTIIISITAVSLMIYIDPWLSLYSLIPLPFLSLIINRMGKELYWRFERVQAHYSRLSAQVQENFAGIRVVKAYGQESDQIKRFRRSNLEFVSKNMSLVKIWGFFLPLMLLFSGMGMLIVLWLGGKAVIVNRITLGEFVAFNGYLIMLVWPITALGWVLNLFQRGATSMGRISQILQQKPDISNASHPIRVTSLRGEIELRNVIFAYEENSEPVLKGISLKIPPGSTLAIVGPTGSGKSTLVNLIPRLYDPTGGSLLIDGTDIRRIPLKILRRHIGYVPQEGFLFSDTIRENIALGKISFKEDEVMAAASASQILEDINHFPRKFLTQTGERGITLSGGQKQRVGLARALIANPRILILDDPFSQVDTSTEEAIWKSIREKTAGSTKILVTHRISSVRDADRIIVLSGGKIVEEGTHKELLARKGTYAELYRKQLIRQELEEL
ncbi:MAG: ABC transporter ATP-binding protein/permease [Candidatus Aminicenantes bacterium]|nr:ABC transporter ATP-binding protein/permease [Candidatus Aminicenantes bacterium]MDH5714849.1 ABC transporter ATP-binding protein/permease [Candidatus Aminicenantes bacterium]